MSCEHTRALTAELALGIADGADRAQALRHLAECANCRRELEQLSAVADELLMLAPERQPAAGFESRVLARLEPAPPRGPRARASPRGRLRVASPRAARPRRAAEPARRAPAARAGASCRRRGGRGSR